MVFSYGSPSWLTHTPARVLFSVTCNHVSTWLTLVYKKALTCIFWTHHSPRHLAGTQWMFGGQRRYEHKGQRKEELDSFPSLPSSRSPPWRFGIIYRSSGFKISREWSHKDPLEHHLVLQVGAVITFQPCGPRAWERSISDFSPWLGFVENISFTELSCLQLRGCSWKI